MNKHFTIRYSGKGYVKSALALILLVVLPSLVLAQGDGPRFYWKGLAGMNAMPVIGSSLSGNANPLDPAHIVQPGSSFSGTIAMTGYVRMFTLFNRSAQASIILPMGRVSSSVTSLVGNVTETAMGFGDPMLQFGINVIGPKAMKGIPDLLRYKPGISVDIIGSLAVPIGEYDNESTLNIGQNRWYGRIGLPIVCQIGKWVPGRRTTIELLPAVWFFSDNKDFVGETIETKPLFQAEGHVTRDFMERLWGSVDVIWYTGAESYMDNDTVAKLNNVGIGGTLGYQINDNLQVTVAYMTSINDPDPDDLKMDSFKVTIIFGWHKMIEGMRRLKGNE